MDKIETEPRIEMVSKSISLSFEHFDFIVKPVQKTRRNAMLKIGEQPLVVSLKGVC